jgi:hypothetical protein
MNRQQIEAVLRSPSRLEELYPRYERRPRRSTGRLAARGSFRPGFILIVIALIAGVAVASRLPLASDSVGPPLQTTASPRAQSIGFGSTVDGFTLGAQEECSNPVGSIDPKFLNSSCSGTLALATAALDAREPGHASIAAIQRFADGTQPGPVDVTGDSPVPTLATPHPGPKVTVFVFMLVDGSVSATGVACGDSASCTGVGSYPRPPADKSTDPGGPIVIQTDPPPEVGLLGQVNAPAPGGVFTPTNAWAGWIDASTFVQVWAGDQPEFGGGGLMMVMRRPGIGDGAHLDPNGEPAASYVPPPTKGGPLTIVAVQDGNLVIRNPKGTDFLFDPAAGAFVETP